LEIRIRITILNFDLEFRSDPIFSYTFVDSTFSWQFDRRTDYYYNGRESTTRRMEVCSGKTENEREEDPATMTAIMMMKAAELQVNCRTLWQTKLVSCW